MFKYDVLVIGAGSGGVRFARLMGSKGFKVGIIEEREIGGTCVLRGCIPKKLLIYASSVARDIRYSNNIGWNFNNSEFNLSKFMKIKENELNRLSSLYKNVLSNNNVDIIKGRATFISKSSVLVNDKEYSADKILIATGSYPRMLPIEGFELAIDSEEFLSLHNLPKNVLILGGGFTALEFTNVLLSLGTKVYIFTRTGNILNSFDHDVALHIKGELEKQGVIFVKANHLESLVKNKDNSIIANFDKQQSLIFDKVVRLIGRKPNTKDLNTKVAGIELTTKSSIKVNEYFETSNSQIYAIGDVIDKANLTPVATKQAMYLFNNLTSKETKPFDYNFIPTAIFSYPEVAKCGLNEKEAINNGYKVEVYKSTFKPLKHTITGADIKCFFKIVVDSKTQKVLGIHIVDLNAAEIMQGFSVALKVGITKAQLDDTIGIHPTSAEELVTLYTKSN